ncbi:MAG: hypothetical protein JXQ29_16635 [Planctomycetes bacterium]|nr:hypothetical protein [Planctomycetota bacterium]
MNTQTFWFPRDVVINQDGDYVVPCLQSNQSSVLLKVSRAGQLTTILTTRELSIPADFDGQARVNIDSGHYLIAGTTCVLEVMDNGVARMWSSGPLAGRSSTLPQDFDTGLIEGQYMGIVYRMEQPLTTIKIPGHYLERTCEFDLQSAPKKRWVAIGYQGGVNYEPIEVFYIDKNTHVTMGTVLDPYKNNANWSNHVNAFDFYRGRHLQTVKTGPGAWDVRISCPAFPGKNYVLVPSAAGYRPGLALADGRRVHLNLDGLSYLALFNLLQPYFNPGPLQLDANGEAVGRIDLGKLPVPLPLNLSMWLAVAVLDPAAPCGIAYLPDTYVMWL